MINATTRQRVVQEAQSWLCTPYHHHGGVKGAGVDCAMLLACVYSAAGVIPEIDPRPYPHDWHMHRSAERFLGWVKQYADRTDTPQPGDVAMFQFGRCVAHGAIVVAWPMVIHAYLDERAVVLTDVSKSSDLCNRLHGFYTFKGA